MFSGCAVPQCIKTWKTRKTEDLSLTFLLMWFVGEILTFTYVLITNNQVGEYQIPLLANYVFNFVLVCYLLYAKWSYNGLGEND